MFQFTWFQVVFNFVYQCLSVILFEWIFLFYLNVGVMDNEMISDASFEAQ